MKKHNAPHSPSTAMHGHAYHGLGIGSGKEVYSSERGCTSVRHSALEEASVLLALWLWLATFLLVSAIPVKNSRFPSTKPEAKRSVKLLSWLVSHIWSLRAENAFSDASAVPKISVEEKRAMSQNGFMKLEMSAPDLELSFCWVELLVVIVREFKTNMKK